jgi:hypothetical protein
LRTVEFDQIQLEDFNEEEFNASDVPARPDFSFSKAIGHFRAYGDAWLFGGNVGGGPG